MSKLQEYTNWSLYCLTHKVGISKATKNTLHKNCKKTEQQTIQDELGKAKEYD